MAELQLTHIALVGARMAAFHEHGYTSRDELSMCRVVPAATDTPLEQLPPAECRELLKAQLPIWVHNIITDPHFPQRQQLLMPLRRFEGELKDSKNDEVVSTVLSRGFKNQPLDPLNLPSTMPMRQRCALLVHIEVWQDAYRRVENDIVDGLTANLPALTQWCKSASADHRVDWAATG